MKRARTRQFFGPGGTANRRGQRATEQAALFDDQEPELETSPVMEVGELERDCRRMTLETSSNVYAQRRAYW